MHHKDIKLYISMWPDDFPKNRKKSEASLEDHERADPD
jgi:hypothetical protein